MPYRPDGIFHGIVRLTFAPAIRYQAYIRPWLVIEITDCAIQIPIHLDCGGNGSPVNFIFIRRFFEPPHSFCAASAWMYCDAVNAGNQPAASFIYAGLNHFIPLCNWRICRWFQLPSRLQAFRDKNRNRNRYRQRRRKRT